MTHRRKADFQTDSLSLTAQPVKPSASVLTPQSDNVESIFTGQRFIITCSHSTPFTILSFRIRTGIYSQNPAAWTQPAVENKAEFLFPGAEQSPQRTTYHCDYNYDFKPEIFSETAPVYLSFKGRSCESMCRLSLYSFQMLVRRLNSFHSM